MISLKFKLKKLRHQKPRNCLANKLKEKMENSDNVKIRYLVCTYITKNLRAKKAKKTPPKKKKSKGQKI